MLEIASKIAAANIKPLHILQVYEDISAGLRDMPVSLLCLGVDREGSALSMWREYFGTGRIIGIDPHPPDNFPNSDGRIRVFEVEYGNSEQLNDAARESSLGGFDFIIDDGSHIGADTAAAFQTLFYRYLKPKGFYVIESWGTGYWDSWPDGALQKLRNEPFSSVGKRFLSHDFGTVGFIKQLVDECALTDIQRLGTGIPQGRKAFISSIQIAAGIAVIQKSV